MTRIDLYHRETLLRRLERLVRIRRFGQNGRGQELNDTGLRLVDRAITVTAADCAEVGAAGQAQSILSRFDRPPSQPNLAPPPEEGA